MAYKNIESQRECSRQHYVENKQYYIDRNNRRRAEFKQLIREIRETVKCSNCPESDWRCIDFHHKDPSKKLFTLSKAGSLAGSKKRILEEIEKCIPLCANCHRKLHSEVYGAIV